jgi:hypothetical protein
MKETEEWWFYLPSTASVEIKSPACGNKKTSFFPVYRYS